MKHGKCIQLFFTIFLFIFTLNLPKLLEEGWNYLWGV